jgi:hypothetical protein
MRDDIFLKKNDLVDFTFDASIVNVFDWHQGRNSWCYFAHKFLPLNQSFQS